MEGRKPKRPGEAGEALATTETRIQDLVRGEVKVSLRIVEVQP